MDGHVDHAVFGADAALAATRGGGAGGVETLVEYAGRAGHAQTIVTVRIVCN
jgi:hypothetical protein